MTLTEQLTDYISAAFAGLWVETSEPDEAQREIAALCQAQGWVCHAWDVARGVLGQTGLGINDPVPPLKFALEQAYDHPETTVVMLLHNYHRFLGSPVVVQHCFNAVLAGKAKRVFFAVLAPTVEIPRELEHVFTVVEHPLPGRDQLSAIAGDLAALMGDDIPSEPVAAAQGLTRYEAEGAFALSLARHDNLCPDTVWELKTQALKKSGLLTLHRGKETFKELGGLDAIKQFCARAVKHSNGVRARGTLLLGVPGTGKSAFAKALGNETGRPTLVLDVGSLMGSLVGQTEANLRQALKIADAMSPCVLFLDEVEKALAGGTSQHQGDSGVAARTLGTLLSWLNDHESDVFTVCTSNNVQLLPPEFSRAERFDGVFFLDLPGRVEKNRIWQLYRQMYGTPELLPHWNEGNCVPPDDNWTGAEIRACCRLAALLGVPLAEAATNVVPVALTAGAQVQALREWASGRCLDATRGRVYHHRPPAEGGTPSRRRSVRRAVS